MAKDIPTDRLFSEEHEWIKIDMTDALVGISDHAQASLGDVVYLELPQPGQVLTKGLPIGVVESVKAVSDIYAPVSGRVKEINQDVLAHPEKINQDPYGSGWLLVMEPSDQDEVKTLLKPEQYEDLLAKEAK